MSSIISRLTSSLMGLLDDSASDSDIEVQIQSIRQAMLDSMATCFDEKGVRPVLWDKIGYAPSIQTLWYLRIDLMMLLSDHHGETVARKALARVTEAFRGLVPANQMPNRNGRR
jgi:hypothetical protein